MTRSQQSLNECGKLQIFLHWTSLNLQSEDTEYPSLDVESEAFTDLVIEPNVQGESVGVFETDVIGHILADFLRCGGRVQLYFNISTILYCHSRINGFPGPGSLSVQGKKEEKNQLFPTTIQILLLLAKS